jgi:uncharacterized membrane protein
MAMVHMNRSLLAASDVSGGVGRIIVWAVVLAVLVVALGYGLLALRRWWLGEDVADAAPEWTLQDLRELKAKGELNEAEYQALRGAAIAGIRGSADGNDGETNGGVASEPGTASEDGYA